MKCFAVRCAVLAAFGVALVAFSSGQTTAANADDPTIKQIMQKVNGGKGVSLCKACNDGVKAEEPKWDELAVKAKTLVPLAKAMSKNKPPKGDEDSWKKFSEGYAKAAEDFEAAVDKKDAKAAQTAMATIADCRGCHTAHRPAKGK
jgi:hypothetical protein